MASDQPISAVRKLLVLVVGAIAGPGLLVSIPAMESGRKVEVTVDAGKVATVKHVAGPEHLVAYRDLVGVWTICDGLTRSVRAGSRETRAGCARRLEAELVDVAEHMLDCVPQLREPGRDHPRWAMISLAYNLGWSRICGSTAAARFRAGDWTRACDAILLWDKAGRPLKVLRGLALRRQREREICRTGLAGYPAMTLQARLERIR